MTYKIELDPITDSIVSIKLYRNVENVNQLRIKLMKGTLPCCMIKPALIWDPFQIVIAANKALTSEKLTTKTIYTEILFNLSMSKNITQSLQKFGIDDKDKNILVVTVGKKADCEAKEVFNEIVGKEVNLSELSTLRDLECIKNAYKLNDESETVDILDSIVSRICIKDIL